ncbi:MAG: alpha-2-macroglobulin family protein, partial [Ignavibacteria bacterium]
EVDRSPFFVKDLIHRGELVLSKQETTEVMPEGMQNKEELIKEQFVEPVIRKDFKDAIFWNANLLTDQNGEVGIELNYPDNITSWRNTIKAITKNSKAGESFYNVIVRKDILIRVETPRYLHEKDEVILPVMIHNYSSIEQKVKVSFDVINGKIISDYNERMNQRILDMNVLKIKSNDAVKLNFKIKVDENVDTLFITAKALVLKSNEQNLESDAVQLKLPVESIGYPGFIVNNSSLSKISEKYSSRIYLSDDKRNLKVILKLSPTLIGNILSSIDELVAYPYGCVEQTMSRFLPAIIVANLNRELNLDIKQNTIEQLPEIISAGLKRLKDFQHTDGGWGWWKDDQTNPFMTAYVMYGLSITRKAGIDVDRRMIENGLKALRNLLKAKNQNENIDIYLLYSFSEAINFDGASKEDRELLINRFNELKKFDNNAYIISKLLEIAIENGLSDEISKLKNKLLKLASVEGNIVYWGEKDFYNRHFVNDPVEITSSAIRSLIISGEKSNLIENAIRWLVNQKRGNLWFSTKQTASVIFSLSEYIKSSDELMANFIARIFVNGKEINSIKFDKNNLKAGELNLVIPSSELKSGMNEIEIEKSGIGKLYFSIIEKYFKTRIEKNENLFEVERKYYVLSYEKEGDKLVKKITELKNEVKVGQEIMVQLKVKTKTDFEYFMLEDPFVPGFERFEEQLGEEYFQRWFYHYKEERDQKTAFFVTNLTKGEYIFNYTAYAQIPGIYTIPPAVASLMYYPEIRSISEERIIKITD